MVSYPTLSNSDGDGLEDISEVIGGTNPLNADSDNDSLSDGIDDDPFTPYQPESETGVLVIGKQIVLDAVFGESGLEGGSLNYLVGEDSYSTYYLIGWVGFSLIPGVGAVADARDAAQAIINGDPVGAVMNAMGAIPGPGDSVKASSGVALFVSKLGGDTKWITRVGKELARTILKYTPDSVTTPILKAIYGNTDVVRLMNRGALASDLRKITERGIHLKDVMHITRVGDDFIPILYKGFNHFKGRHIIGTIDVGKRGTTLFPMKDQVVWYGKTYPGKSSMTETEVLKLIDEALETQLREWSTEFKKITVVFPTEKYGIKEINIWISQKEGIQTVFPLKGTEVFRWFNGKWNPTI